MVMTKKLKKIIIRQEQQLNDLTAFFAAVVHRNGDKIELTLEEIKNLPKKQFKIDVGEGKIVISLT